MMMIDATFGRMWRTMIRQFRTPIYLAATTNSRSRRLIVMPRTMRELIIQLKADSSTIIQMMSPLVRCTTIAIRRKLGTTIIRSTIHIRARSRQPPK